MTRTPFLLLALLLLAGFPALAAPPIEILEKTTIFTHTDENKDDPANRSGLNHGPTVTVLPDGRVMAAWFSAPFEGADSQRILHSFSADQGKTWSPAQVLQDFEGRADFDPSLFTAGKETFFFFTAASPMTVCFRQSSDSGKTWTEPVALTESNRTTRSNGIQLSTGELLVPMHVRGTKAASVLKSTDGGKTWQQFGEVATPAGEGGEPSIAQTKSGPVHMTLRTRDGQLWRSVSIDKGETWAAPEKTGLISTTSASHLLRTRDGTLVLTVNPGPAPLRFPLQMRVSRDEGAQWSDPVILEERHPQDTGKSICYPTLAELPDGTLIAVWTEIKDRPGILYGDIRSARLRLVNP